MPYRVVHDPPLIRMTFSGALLITDLLDASRELREMEWGMATIPDRITDLSDIEERDSNFGGVLTLAMQRRGRTFPNSFRSAIVAPSQLAVGYARMFQILNTNPQIDVQIFDSVASAEEWLGSR